MAIKWLCRCSSAEKHRTNAVTCIANEVLSSRDSYAIMMSYARLQVVSCPDHTGGVWSGHETRLQAGGMTRHNESNCYSSGLILFFYWSGRNYI